MKSLTSNQIRRMWLDFFASKGHMIEPGASLVPHNDPTLLWINSGVAALKKYFDGSETPSSPRITNAQKSLRTNDIDNVGMTARHHTFFEMLGNFSIGDYFRHEAITWGYELLTDPKWFGFDPSVLYFTVHPSDLQSVEEWINVGVDPSHIIPCIGNFWEIGEGPCGPNTEIFVDRGLKYDPNHVGIKLLQEDMENDRYIEIWNIVFSQYNSKSGLSRDQYPELPQKNIDTGAGLERLVCIFQDAETNFDTDLFLPMIYATERLAKHPYDGEYKMAYRVIADHIRTCTFALADGALFSNEGRGYVLRRLLRRAVRYGKKLGIEGTFMDQLVNVCADAMQEFYPYLMDKVAHIAKLVKLEEERFAQTLANGEALLIDYLNRNQTSSIVNQETAFQLYDTYGFPLELTVEIAKERGFKVDKEGFAQAMEQQKQRARSARDGEQSMRRQSEDLLAFDTPSTFDYSGAPIQSKVLALFQNGVRVPSLSDQGDVILDHTIFYAESGGQVADKGTLTNQEGVMQVVDVQKAPHHQHLHHVETNGLLLQEGDLITLNIDQDKRMSTMRHHSSAHLLQKALQQVLGSHIQQAGSYVDELRLRFDFTHFEKISKEQLNQIEQRVNEVIFQALPADIQEMSLAEAKQKGAMALFSEKYGERVRVVGFGDYSMELCGGCHVNNTSNIGVFAIESEESISSGVRRIQAVAGMEAYRLMKQKEALMQSIADLLDALSIYEVKDRLQAFRNQQSDLRQEMEQLKARYAQLKAKELLLTADMSAGYPKIIAVVEQVDKETFVKIIDAIKAGSSRYFVFLANKQEDKIALIAAADMQLVKTAGVHCGKLVKEAAALLGGSGGGRPDLAQAGGKDATKLDEVLQLVKSGVK